MPNPVGAGNLFIPNTISHIGLAEFPRSAELTRILTRLRIRTFEDASRYTLRDFEQASDSGGRAYLEFSDLIWQARQRAAENGKAHIIDEPLNEPNAENASNLHDGVIQEGTADEVIFIPQEARGVPLAAMDCSVRLRHILEFKGFKIAGDLHTQKISQFYHYRNCGRKTVEELRELIRSLQRRTVTGSAMIAVERIGPLSMPGALYVPESARQVALSELPLSVRLENVLKKKHFKILGDVHGVLVHELRKTKNCGKTTIAELKKIIEQVSTGKLNIQSEAPWNPADFLQALDLLTTKLPDRTQKILLRRFLGTNGRLPTLEDLGSEFGLTRERIRQILEKGIERIRKNGGRLLRGYLSHVKSICAQEVCPLTPALLSQWLSGMNRSAKHELPFYVRLIGELDGAAPIWPPTREAFHEDSKLCQKAENQIRTILSHEFHAISLHDLFWKLRALPEFGSIKSQHFLALVHGSRHVRIDLTKPDTPLVTLSRIVSSEIAGLVLESSKIPLTAEEILSKAQDLAPARTKRWKPLTLSNTLAEAKGFYLLGPRSYGLRKHFSLPSDAWKKVRNECHTLMEKMNRPTSTPEIVGLKTFPWIKETNSYELACILREDHRFVDLGKFLFALKSWGVEERQYVKDLIPQVLRQAGRPLIGAEVARRLRKLRSISATSIATWLRTHPAVRDFGFGHYGLKSWDESVKTSIVSDAELISRVIRRATPVLTFKRLCEILEVGVSEELATTLWLTTSSATEIIRLPDERTNDTRLIHRACRLERALWATAQELNRPLPVYELQWEINERFGPLFADRTIDEIRRCLEHSSVFLRDAAGEFILDVHLDQLGLDVDAIRAVCAKILSDSNEIVGCEDLLERIENEGVLLEELSPDMLATMLRENDTFQEIGRDRFRVRHASSE